MKMTKSRLTEKSKELARTWGRFICTNESILKEEKYTLETNTWSALDFSGFFKSTLSHSKLTDIQWTKFIEAYKLLHVNSNSIVPQELLNATLKELRSRRDLSVYCS